MKRSDDTGMMGDGHDRSDLLHRLHARRAGRASSMCADGLDDHDGVVHTSDGQHEAEEDRCDRKSSRERP